MLSIQRRTSTFAALGRHNALGAPMPATATSTSITTILIRISGISPILLKCTNTHMLMVCGGACWTADYRNKTNALDLAGTPCTVERSRTGCNHTHTHSVKQTHTHTRMRADWCRARASAQTKMPATREYTRLGCHIGHLCAGAYALSHYHTHKHTHTHGLTHILTPTTLDSHTFGHAIYYARY